MSKAFLTAEVQTKCVSSDDNEHAVIVELYRTDRETQQSRSIFLHNDGGWSRDKAEERAQAIRDYLGLPTREEAVRSRQSGFDYDLEDEPDYIALAESIVEDSDEQDGTIECYDGFQPRGPEDFHGMTAENIRHCIAHIEANQLHITPPWSLIYNLYQGLVALEGTR